METAPIGVTLIRKWPAHFSMPTTKHPRYQSADPAPDGVLRKTLELLDMIACCVCIVLNLSKVPNEIVFTMLTRRMAANGAT